MKLIHLAVNGTLMRGFPLNHNLTDGGAEFIREDLTSENYRLWSIDDVYPAMLRDEENGYSIKLEIWAISSNSITELLEKEPPGLSVGKIELVSGEWIPGILGESYITNGQKEITAWGGWREYITP